MFSRKKINPYILTFLGLEVEISRKKIRNIYVKVNRRTGKVRVSCPWGVSERVIEQFVFSKLDWIRRQKAKASKLPEKSEFKFETGETHYFRGEEYTLKIERAQIRSSAKITGSEIVLKVPENSDLIKREKVLDRFYRNYLKETIPELISKWEPVMNVSVNEFGVKKMKTRWGTCNIRAKRIWLNLELAKKTPGCLESVVVHEMVHLLERLHNKRFYGLMDSYFPEWRIFEGELNSPID